MSTNKDESSTKENNKEKVTQIELKIPKVSESKKIKKEKTKVSAEKSQETSTADDKSAKKDDKKKKDEKKRKARSPSPDTKKKEMKKKFRPKKLKNAEWVNKVLRKLYCAPTENPETKQLTFSEGNDLNINAVRAGDYFEKPYLVFGDYDFQYDDWNLKLKMTYKKKNKDTIKWKPKEASKPYFNSDMKDEITEVCVKLDDLGRQSGSEVEYMSEEESSDEE